MGEGVEVLDGDGDSGRSGVVGYQRQLLGKKSPAIVDGHAGGDIGAVDQHGRAMQDLGGVVDLLFAGVDGLLAAGGAVADQVGLDVVAGEGQAQSGGGLTEAPPVLRVFFIPSIHGLQAGGAGVMQGFDEFFRLAAALGDGAVKGKKHNRQAHGITSVAGDGWAMGGRSAAETVRAFPSRLSAG